MRSSVTVAILGTESTRRITSEWDDLANRLGASPFLRPDWIATWCDVFGWGETRSFTARRHGRLVGLVPLRYKRGVLASPTNWHTPEFDFLATDDEALGALCKGVLSTGAHRVDLKFVNNGSRAQEGFSRLAGEASYSVLKRVLQESPFIDTTRDWEQYEGSLNGAFRRELRRRRRRMGEIATASLDLVTSPTDIGRALDEGFELEGSGWKTKRGTAILSHPETRLFYRSIAY